MQSLRRAAVVSLLVGLAVCTVPLLAVPGAQRAAAAIQTPEQFFGFRIGTDGELARYPRIVEYLRHLAAGSDRLRFEELGKTTMGNPYVLATISSGENLSRLDRLIEINRRLADPRGLPESEALKLAQEGRPFYLLYGTIHSTEVGNTQAIIEIAHRLATDNSAATREILDNIVLLVVPSQNPDGQLLVIDHWYKTKGTKLNRVYPDLYHKYVGHDDNRDWFMFTQQETRLAVEKVQNRYKPQLTHDMHQMGSTGSRIFVPPFDDPYDPNIHPILAQGQAQIGLAMASALVAENKTGAGWLERYDLWAPARQYMVYHGQPRILTEIASASLADPFVNPQGADKPLGPQEARWNFPLPYRGGDWRLRQIVDYGITVALAGMTHMAKYRSTWLENFYRVNADWAGRKEAPYAFVVPAEQRDPFETFELLSILKFGDVEVHRARAPFTAGGKQYAAGSWVVRTAQPSGAFAKTMLEQQVYPDLRLFPGGPPKPPYDVTGHTLWMLMGVTVGRIDTPFEADLELLPSIAPPPSAFPRARSAFVLPPESNAAFLAATRLQQAKIPLARATARFEAAGRSLAPGTWIVPASAASARILEEVSRETGLPVMGMDRPAAVDTLKLKPETRVGLFKAPNNMPAGWMKWLFEQYGFNHRYMSSLDFREDLAAKYDVIVLPAGTSRDSIVRGLEPERHDKTEWEWAFGVGEDGWTRLRDWVKNGGTLLAIGSAVETARQLLDLPIEKALPETSRRARFQAQGRGGAGQATVPAAEIDRAMREAFSSPARLAAALRERVIDPTSVFYCPGSLLANEFDPDNPVAWGMPDSWPVFFESDQAYRIRPGFGIHSEVVARYPASGPVLQSGWLLGEDLLRDQANVIAFRVGRGYVVTYGSQIDFRAQPRATFKLLFNAMFNGPAITGGPRRATATTNE
ncbi:MAG TPA: M14 metallopeptidase family protein [Vicinamibacterales bacterium]|nr:M14 metallopeptidase family protein [Vicinamibacterales bacterium]